MGSINPVVAGQHPKRDHWMWFVLNNELTDPWLQTPLVQCSHIGILWCSWACNTAAAQLNHPLTDWKGTLIFMYHLMSCIQSLLAEAKSCCSEATIKATVTHSEGTLLSLKSRIKNKIVVVLPRSAQGGEESCIWWTLNNCFFLSKLINAKLTALRNPSN